MKTKFKNLNRLEFVITWACTGRCKHCSEGDHLGGGVNIEAEAAVRAIHRLTERYPLQSLMTFGGEPLLHPDTVCRIHEAAREAGIPKRQLITNGFFARDPERIRAVAASLAESGVNDLRLSVDAFHQETIPLEPVKLFAEALVEAGVPVKMQPAWLVSEEDENPYNQRTRDVLAEFPGITVSDGNVIFPSGNALKYLGEYFDAEHLPENPYVEDPEDVRAISIDPDGSLLGGNICRQDILEIIDTEDKR